MGSAPTTTTTQSGTSTQSPYAPAVPYLNELLGQISKGANIGPSSAQSSAFSNLYNQASSVPSFGAGGSNIVNQMINYGRGTVPGTSGKVSGYGTLPQQQALQQALTQGQGILGSSVGGANNVAGSAYNTSTGMIDPTLRSAFAPIQNAYATGFNTLQPYLNTNFLNPNSNPYLQPTLNALGQQADQATNSLFAASGRDPAGNAQAAKAGATAMTNAEAPYLLGQFNTNAGLQQAATGQLGNLGLGTGEAIGGLGLQGAGLFGNLGLGTAGLLGGLGISEAGTLGNLTSGLTGAETAQQQQQFETGLQGMQAAEGLPGLYTAPGTAALQGATALANSPLANLPGLESIINPIAGLGGTSVNFGTGNTQYPQSTFGNILGGALGANALLGGNGMFGSSGALSGLFGGGGAGAADAFVGGAPAADFAGGAGIDALGAAGGGSWLTSALPFLALA